VPSRPVHKLWFAHRSPVITPRQSVAIVEAMQALGFLDSKGYLKDDPRVGQSVSWTASCWVDLCSRCLHCCIRSVALMLGAAWPPWQSLNRTKHPLVQIPGSPLRNWNVRLVKKLPWLHMDPKKPPMLSVLSDRSSIFEGAHRGGRQSQLAFWSSASSNGQPAADSVALTPACWQCCNCWALPALRYRAACLCTCMLACTPSPVDPSFPPFCSLPSACMQK
jgi:hypothetical protein